ncbi:hypothetical protein E2C01_057655 [Portunus trituberculatus]|uniref:Uncharacterized protein n=1 Tax=Portunus trituberculatus TaxID=210409 RepID=A0A5B7H131_PORTR|nr:hypothetical protein [Portunus trituberculatus]
MAQGDEGLAWLHQIAVLQHVTTPPESFKGKAFSTSEETQDRPDITRLPQFPPTPYGAVSSFQPRLTTQPRTPRNLEGATRLTFTARPGLIINNGRLHRPGQRQSGM